MARPTDNPAPAAPSKPASDWTRDLHAPFQNCPLTDFTSTETRATFAQAVAKEEKQMPWHVPSSSTVTPGATAPLLFHVSPNNKTRIATSTNPATVGDVEQAIAVAKKAWPAWRDLPLETRAARVNELGARFERDRLRLTAMEVHEQAKPWREADADVAEAIDFCRYYARQALIELSPRTQGNLPGEINTLTMRTRTLRRHRTMEFPARHPLRDDRRRARRGQRRPAQACQQANAIAFAFHQHALAVRDSVAILPFLPGDGTVVGDALVGIATSSRSPSPAAARSHRNSQARGGNRAGPDDDQARRLRDGRQNAIVVDDEPTSTRRSPA